MTLERKLEAFGDRTSSFITAYPGFESFAFEEWDAEVRFAKADHAWIAATEPLAPNGEARSSTLAAFHREAYSHGKKSLSFPLSETLAQDLANRGADIIPVGAEPIFELARYFTPGRDPLDRFPRLRGALAAKKLEVQEIHEAEMATERPRLEEIERLWLAARRTRELGFLSQVEPFFAAHQKRFFVVRIAGSIEAFLTAVPVKPWGKRWYFAEVLRSPGAKAGVVEALFIETMRLLHQDGAEEIRLGMCPLAHLEQSTDRRARLMARVAQHFEFIYGFSSMVAFKEKLGPTRWETLYAASFQRLGIWALLATLQVHLGEKPLRQIAWARLSLLLRSWMRPEIMAQPALPHVIAVAPLAAGFFVLLHTARHLLSPIAAVFEQSAYRPENVTALAAIFSPLFHTTPYHFAGNLISLLFFGSLVELIVPKRVVIAAFALGLWASNPLTHLAVAPWLPSFDPTGYQHFLAEWDYGSSNGVYALVGAFAALLKKPRVVLLPFVLNALFLIFALQSWLSIHHLMGLALGYFTVAAAFVTPLALRRK